MKSIVILLAVLGLALCEDDPPPEAILEGSKTEPPDTGESRSFASEFVKSCAPNTKIGGCGRRCTASFQSKCLVTRCSYRIRSGYYCGLLFYFVKPITYTGTICRYPGTQCSKSIIPWGGPSSVSSSWKPCRCCTKHKWIKRRAIIKHNGWYYWFIKFWVKVPDGCQCSKGR